MAFRTAAFLDGINNGLSLAQRFSTMRDQRDMREVANAMPEESTGYTAADGEQLQGLASAKDPSGNPYYNVTADEAGNYSVAPNQDAQGFGLSEYQGSTDPVKMGQGTVTDFFGERTAGSLSDGQVNARRTGKMADVISRSDPERASRMRTDAKNQERQGLQYQREEQDWQRKEKAAKEDDAFKQAYKDTYGSTIYATRMAEYTSKAEAYAKQLADRKAALESGVSPEKLGPAMEEPAKPGYTVAESLTDQAALLDLRIKAGKADPNAITQYAETVKKTHEEGYIKALQLAQSGAPIASIADAFNQSGQTRFDPSTVVSDEMGKGPEGVSTRIIKIKDPQTGEIQTINTLSELDGMGKAASYFDRYFKGTAAERDATKSNLTLSEIRARGDEERKTIDYKRTNGDTGKDSIGREERLRYTSLFQDAGRRQSEAQKSLNALLKERSYANARPGSPQAEELDSLREAIKQHSDERKTYQSMLAEGGSKAKDPAPDQPARSSGGNMSLRSTAAESDRMSILNAELNKARAAGNVQDVAALEREIGRVGGQSQGLSAIRQPASNGQPVKITTKAEHAALPKGTRYTAPDGSVRIKQ
jgi:hypothetical protein